MRDFGLTSAEADKAFEVAEGEVLARRDAIFEKDFREVLEYVLTTEQRNFEQCIEDLGEQVALDTHLWSKAMNIFLEFGFDGQHEHAEFHYSQLKLGDLHGLIDPTIGLRYP